jgi:hypothetical protein
MAPTPRAALLNALQKQGAGEPDYTNLTHEFRGCLDYVFFSQAAPEDGAADVACLRAWTPAPLSAAPAPAAPSAGVTATSAADNADGSSTNSPAVGAAATPVFASEAAKKVALSLRLGLSARATESGHPGLPGPFPSKEMPSDHTPISAAFSVRY